MIYIQVADKRTMFLFITEQDVNNSRGGARTILVDEAMTGGAQFSRVIVSHVRNNQQAFDLLKQAGHKVNPDGLIEPGPSRPEETKCAGCQGIMLRTLLHKDKCIACWCEMAEAYKPKE